MIDYVYFFNIDLVYTLNITTFSKRDNQIAVRTLLRIIHATIPSSAMLFSIVPGFLRSLVFGQKRKIHSFFTPNNRNYITILTFNQ